MLETNSNSGHLKEKGKANWERIIRIKLIVSKAFGKI
jgi:hypothetical protein